MTYNIKYLRDFIAKPESGGDYNIVYGGIPSKLRPSKLLTTMTIAEVLEWQTYITGKGVASTASGKYQVIRKTLSGVYKEAGLTLNSLYDEGGQEDIALALLKRRGLDAYLVGTISAEKFADNLSKEWASLPCIFKDRKGRPASGQSYYAGDGLNRSHVTREALLAAVKTVGSATAEPEKPAPANFLQALLKCLKGV